MSVRGARATHDRVLAGAERRSSALESATTLPTINDSGPDTRSYVSEPSLDWDASSLELARLLWLYQLRYGGMSCVTPRTTAILGDHRRSPDNGKARAVFVQYVILTACHRLHSKL